MVCSVQMWPSLSSLSDQSVCGFFNLNFPQFADLSADNNAGI